MGLIWIALLCLIDCFLVHFSWVFVRMLDIWWQCFEDDSGAWAIWRFYEMMLPFFGFLWSNHSFSPLSYLSYVGDNVLKCKLLRWQTQNQFRYQPSKGYSVEMKHCWWHIMRMTKCKIISDVNNIVSFSGAFYSKWDDNSVQNWKKIFVIELV